MNKEHKINKRRLRSAYLTTIISISMVLVLLGVVGMLVLKARNLADYVRENIAFNLYMKDGVKEVEIRKLQKILDTKEFVRETKVVTKEDAARDLQEVLGEDFVNFLGYIPLLSSIDVFLYANYAVPDSIYNIEQVLSAYPEVKEIEYQESLIHLVNDNVNKISIILMAFSGLMFLIALTLINNTIRLAIYSKRFIINTMALVGATRAFIRRPFLSRSIVHGILSALVAIGMLTGMVYAAERSLSGIVSLKDVEIMAMVFAFVLLVGIIINWISTFLAVNKYLRMNVDKLYY